MSTTSNAPPAETIARDEAQSRRWTAWLPALLISAAIFALSSIPGRNIPTVEIIHIDKLVHMLVYSLLGVAIARGLHRGRAVKPTARLALLTLLIGAAYGVSDEAHQLLTPLRSCELFDGVADALGSVVGGTLYVIVARTRRPRPSRS